MMIFQLRNFLLVLFLTCVIISAGEQKKDLSSIWQIVPREVTQKITSYLPTTEQEKMFLINKKFFEDTYFVKKVNRIRAFKSYLHYPYLSRFLKDVPQRRADFSREHFAPEGIILFNTNAETNTLQSLLRHQENREEFTRLLFKEANPIYFDIESWCQFFKLKSSKVREIVSSGNEVQGNIRIISLQDPSMLSLLSNNDVNKVLIVELMYIILMLLNCQMGSLKRSKRTYNQKIEFA